MAGSPLESRLAKIFTSKGALSKHLIRRHELNTDITSLLHSQSRQTILNIKFQQIRIFYPRQKTMKSSAAQQSLCEKNPIHER